MESASQPILLTFGLDGPLDNERFRVIHAESEHDLFRHLREHDRAVLVLGPQLTSAQALEILSQCADQRRASLVTIVLCAGPEPELFQRFVDEGLIYYLARREISIEQLRSLSKSCRDRALAKTHNDSSPLNSASQDAEQLLDLCVRLPMQTKISDAAGLVARTMHESIDANYVQCFIYDAEDDTLVPANALETKEISYSAASGLTAFSARTGEALNIERVGADARYDSDIDDPARSDDARFIAEPILGVGGLPIAVIMAVRGGESPVFSAEDSRLLRSLADCAAPTFNQLILQRQVQAQLTRRAAQADSNPDIFRQEALDYHIRSWDRQGDVIKTLPAWLRTSYWIVLVIVLLGLVGVALMPGVKHFFGKVN